MSIWANITAYQRAAWLPQAAAMDELIGGATIGTESGTDNGLTSHSLSSTVTAVDGTSWTATSTGSASGVTGTLTSNNAETPATVIQENPDAAPPSDPSGP